MMDRLKTALIVLFVLVGSAAMAQSVADADSYFTKGEYQQAMEAYRSLLKKKPKDALYNYRLACSAYMLGDKELAIDHFKVSASKHPMAYLYLGGMYFDKYYFGDAADAYRSYIANPAPEEKSLEEIKRKLAQAELGARFLKRVENIAIVDSMVVEESSFMSRFKPADEIGSLTQNPGLPGGNFGGLAYTTQRGDRTYFSKIVDEHFDLFTKNKLLSDWSEELPLNDLNTKDNENFPFLMLDGVTLYYASDGPESMGGYDIFVTRLNMSTNSFLKPENVGMPYNSPYNDYMMVIDELHNVGWFASDRYLPDDKVAIYQFVPNAQKKIYRDENLDSLIAKSRIDVVKPLKGANQNAYLLQEVTPEQSAHDKIYINDEVKYLDEKEFVSNVARNLYFQSEKMAEDLDASVSKLEKLKLEYTDAMADKKKELTGEIMTLEKKIRVLKPQVEQKRKEMRNEELKSL